MSTSRNFVPCPRLGINLALVRRATRRQAKNYKNGSSTSLSLPRPTAFCGVILPQTSNIINRRQVSGIALSSSGSFVSPDDVTVSRYSWRGWIRERLTSIAAEGTSDGMLSYRHVDAAGYPDLSNRLGLLLGLKGSAMKDAE